MATSESDHADVPDEQIEVADSAAEFSVAKPWYRRPRSLAAIGVVVAAAIGAGAYSVSHHAASPRPNQTIQDYLSENKISMSPVHRGDPGTPVINFPLPEGWSDAGVDTPRYAYGEAVFDNSANPDDPAFIDVLLSKINGDADPAKILEYAPGELRKLQGYQSLSEPHESKLSGFDSVDLAGLYTRDGQERTIAQKTIVIPTPNGLYVLQLNADAPKAEAPVLQKATGVIDEKTQIIP